MSRPASGKLVMVLLSLNAAALIATTALLLSQTQWLPSAFAQVPAAEANSPYLIAPGQFATNVWGCYILDTRTQTLCAYVYQPGEKILRLQAARGISQDLQLQSFNTEPAPAEVVRLLQKQSELQSAPPAAAPAPPDETETK